MRAVVCHEARLETAERPDPVPGPGQVLLEVARCGICGSDLHARHHADELADVMAQTGYHDVARARDRVVFGHEFSGRVAEYGPKTRRRVATGDPVVALPLLRRDGAVHAMGFSEHAPGAYAERVVVEESLMLAVPNGFSAELAALTEPLAVGLHAVRRSEIGRGDVAIVVGCGPIGLAVICMLKARGVRRVIASDLSPGRRALAQACGADVVVDPGERSPYEAAGDGHGHLRSAPEALEAGVGAMEKLRRFDIPWHHVWRVAEAAGVARPKRPVIFECVGVPGMIDSIVAEAPLFSRVVVVGVCMAADAIRPALAVNKELELRFVVGYLPVEFRDTLHMLAEGKVLVTPLVTGEVGLDGVAGAFDALGDPEAHAKILVDPRSAAVEPVARG